MPWSNTGLTSSIDQLVYTGKATKGIPEPIPVKFSDRTKNVIISCNYLWILSSSIRL